MQHQKGRGPFYKFDVFENTNYWALTALTFYQEFCYLQHPSAEELLVLGQIDVVASVATSFGIGVHSASGLQGKHYFKAENDQSKKTTWSVNSFTKIGGTNDHITKFNFEMESKKTTGADR